MLNRRKFLEKISAAGAVTLLPGIVKSMPVPAEAPDHDVAIPAVISTWSHGIPANEKAMEVMRGGGSVVDAVEQGVRIPEGDPDNRSVGLGGTPDRDGHVTLDASIMGSDGNAGAVCFLEHIIHPISVARLVMEKTPHVLLAGEGALQFALENGFEEHKLLTPETEKSWKEWVKESNYNPEVNWEDKPNEFHDTIGLLAMDENGDMAGACTTSGLGYKMRGRVGDSPIIGAGLFVDNEIGGATATGMGELVMKTLGSFLVVELMRQGRSPQQACKEAVERIVKKVPENKIRQVGFIAMNKKGETGAFCLQPGFNYALHQNDENKMIESKSYY